MSRRRKVEKGNNLTKFNDKVLSKFINIVMYDGKLNLKNKFMMS